MSSRPRKHSSFGKSTLENPYEGREGLVYARVSSKRQEIEGSGLESQEGRCIKDIKSILVDYKKTFPDSFTGGGDFMKRPAMKEMLEYIDERPHKKFVVVFDDLKRFARDVEFHLKLRAAFKARDVLLRCLNYNFDESPEGRFSEIIMAAQAELERHQNSRQVVQKQKARLELGYWPFGGKKGYQIVKDPIHGKLAIPYKKEAGPLKEALEGFSTGVFVRKIDACRFLVKKKFWSGQSPEKYIDKFSSILHDPFYAGYIEYKSWEVERRLGHHKGIISIETFEKNQKRCKREDLGKRIRVDLSPEFPLRGLLVCAECGKHLTAAPSKGRPKKYNYYICHNKPCKMAGKSLRKKDVEDRFNKLLKTHVLKKEVEPLITAVFNKVWSEEVAVLEKDQLSKERTKKELENKISQLSDMVISAKSERLKATYEKQIEQKAQELEDMEEEPIAKMDLNIPYRTALDKSIGLLRSPYFAWHKLELVERHRLFYFIFTEKLEYDQKEGYRTEKIPSAVRLFEEFVCANPQDVEMPRIELGCNECLSNDSTELVFFVV